MEIERDDKFKKYGRPYLSVKNNKASLDVMILDIETSVEFNRSIDKDVSVLRCFCIDRKENTYLIHVHDFYMYFYVISPIQTPGMEQREEQLKKDIEQALNNHVGANDRTKVVKSIEYVDREDIMNYKGPSGVKKFVKITIFNHEKLNRLRTYFEDGKTIGGIDFQNLVYESQIGYPLRFMIDNAITGMSWVTLPAGCYEVMPEEAFVSTCNLEARISASKLVTHRADDPAFSDIAPLRILSFDIEACNPSHFPNPEEDPVITIGVSCKLHNSKKEDHKVVFQLNSCDDIVDTEVLTYEDEKDLLEAFNNFIDAYDPDIITGYNILNFDFSYLFNRIKTVVGKPIYWGRLREEETKLSKGKFQSKIMGFRETNEVSIEGRIQIDMMMHMLAEKKLRSYSLNYVSYFFLSEQKEDVAWQMLSKLMSQNSASRKKIASYCLKDALLALRLFEKLKCIYNYVEMARVTGVPMKFLFTRGQQIKVLSQLFRQAREVGMIIPHKRVTAASQEVQYEGGDVLEPQKGFYTIPIATLDFASLYPSIMISNNICYTTLIKPEVARTMDPSDYGITPANSYFVKSSIRKGLLCVVLENLLSARKKVKGELEAAKKSIAELSAKISATEDVVERKALETQRIEQEFLVDVLDGRQLAIKISANSVYGFTGAGMGSLPCIEIAASVTSIGRMMIGQTRDKVMSHFTKANGFAEDAEVIYGDTDSVMINFKERDLRKAMDLGRAAAELLTKQFVKPVKLEFEKVYYPFLLISKKRYAGLLYTKPEAPDRKDTKGVESVRRDNCLLVKTMVDKVLDLLLYEQNIQKVVRYVQGTLQDLNRGKIDISQLIISRSINRNIEDGSYKVPMAHVEVAKKLKQRNPAFSVNIGDRIPYVITCGDKNAKNYERSECPTYAFEKHIPLDLNYYIEDQIRPPLERVLNAVMNSKELFEGAHMVAKSSGPSSFGIGKFMSKKESCLKCKTEVKFLPNGYLPAFCTKCSSDHKTAQDIYFDKVMQQKALEEEFGRLWSECQRCEGSMLQEVICSNNDCQIYYRRSKIKTELKTSEEILRRFDDPPQM